jgi:hypothetical protein
MEMMFLGMLGALFYSPSLPPPVEDLGHFRPNLNHKREKKKKGKYLKFVLLQPVKSLIPLMIPKLSCLLGMILQRIQSSEDSLVRIGLFSF